jgi:hypothetical protein
LIDLSKRARRRKRRDKHNRDEYFLHAALIGFPIHTTEICPSCSKALERNNERPRSSKMKRDCDNHDMLLLSIVALIGLSIAGLVELSTPKVAMTNVPLIRVTNDEGVRVIVPFVPNVKPSQR